MGREFFPKYHPIPFSPSLLFGYSSSLLCWTLRHLNNKCLMGKTGDALFMGWIFDQKND